MQDYNDPQLALVQTREALRIVRHFYGHKPSHISFDEKAKQAEIEIKRNFRTRAKRFLADLGFKVR